MHKAYVALSPDLSILIIYYSLPFQNSLLHINVLPINACFPTSNHINIFALSNTLTIFMNSIIINYSTFCTTAFCHTLKYIRVFWTDLRHLSEFWKPPFWCMIFTNSSVAGPFIYCFPFIL